MVQCEGIVSLAMPCLYILKRCSKVSVTDAIDGSFQVSYNSKFDFTAKSLVTNIVDITRVLCTIKVGPRSAIGRAPDS